MFTAPTFAANTTLEQWLTQFDPADRPVAKNLYNEVEFYDLDKTRQTLKSLHSQLKNNYGVTADNTNFLALGKHKSGSVLLYLYRQTNFFPFTPRMEKKKPETPFIDYSEFKVGNATGKENLVIVDDGIFSGQDLLEYFNRYKKQLSQYNKVFVVTLTATQRGLDNINNNAKKNGFKPPVVLYDKLLNSICDDPEKAKSYKALNEKYHQRLPERLEELQHKSVYPVAYFWNAPIMCPSLLTYSYDGVWDSVYQRYWGQPTTQRGEKKPDRGESETSVSFQA